MESQETVFEQEIVISSVCGINEIRYDFINLEKAIFFFSLFIRNIKKKKRYFLLFFVFFKLEKDEKSA